MYNESGIYRYEAKVAVAYAYLNRTGGTVRQPKSAEISHYEVLKDRWDNYNNDSKLTFIKWFPDCVKAAKQRLSDTKPADNDPTKGATHWASPMGLDKYDPKSEEHEEKLKKFYKRTIGKHTVYYPKWGRDPKSKEAEALKEKSSYTKDYNEFTAKDVPKEEFLFYTGVK